MHALIIVDVQKDFLPGGALGVNEGDKILPVIQQLMQQKFDVIVATKDWHPKDHGSFAVSHGKKIGDRIDLFGLEQILWPVHCVQGTNGAEFAPGLDVNKFEHVFHKGTDKNIDSYSTFFDNGHFKSTGLETYLHKKGIQDLYIAGLTTEYCVKYSVLDARSLGFNVYVIENACKPVDLKEGDGARALEEMRAAGAHIISLNAVKL